MDSTQQIYPTPQPPNTPTPPFIPGEKTKKIVIFFMQFAVCNFIIAYVLIFLLMSLIMGEDGDLEETLGGGLAILAIPIISPIISVHIALINAKKIVSVPARNGNKPTGPLAYSIITYVTANLLITGGGLSHLLEKGDPQPLILVCVLWLPGFIYAYFKVKNRYIDPVAPLSSA